MNPAACVQASKCLPLTFFFVYRILRDIVMMITTVATFFIRQMKMELLHTGNDL